MTEHEIYYMKQEKLRNTETVMRTIEAISTMLIPKKKKKKRKRNKKEGLIYSRIRN